MQHLRMVDILILLFIMVIIAAIVVPEFTAASLDMRDITLNVELNRLRECIDSYRADHDGKAPDATRIVSQLTMRTNRAGRVIPPGGKAEDYPFGPYLTRPPRNPFANRRLADHVRTGTTGNGDETAGWYYNSKTGLISPDDNLHAGL